MANQSCPYELGMTCTNVAIFVAVNGSFLVTRPQWLPRLLLLACWRDGAYGSTGCESPRLPSARPFEGCLAPTNQRSICPYGYVHKRKRCLIESPPCGKPKSRWIANGAAQCIRKLVSTYPGKNSLHTMQSLDIKTLF